MILDTRKDPDNIRRGCLKDHADHIVDRPLLCGPVDPDAISEIGSNDARPLLTALCYFILLLRSAFQGST